MNKPKTILIADDDRDDRELFIEAVHAIDDSIDCISVENGEAALDLLTHPEGRPVPDFIFLDLNMPQMDGKKCLAELKKNKVTRNIPVVMYSTGRSEPDVEETQALGATYFLKKASRFGQLKKDIAEILQGQPETYPGKTPLT